MPRNWKHEKNRNCRTSKSRILQYECKLLEPHFTPGVHILNVLFFLLTNSKWMWLPQLNHSSFYVFATECDFNNNKKNKNRKIQIYALASWIEASSYFSWPSIHCCKSGAEGRRIKSIHPSLHILRPQLTGSGSELRSRSVRKQQQAPTAHTYTQAFRKAWVLPAVAILLDCLVIAKQATMLREPRKEVIGFKSLVESEICIPWAESWKSYQENYYNKYFLIIIHCEPYHFTNFLCLYKPQNDS